MEYRAWEPFYARIRQDFGFSQTEDEAVAAELDELLGGRRTGLEDLRALLAGRIVTVAGNGANLAMELPRARGLLITADEATSVALRHGARPAILVTDLDGDVEDQVRANAEGTIAIVHGHGDNGPAIRTWAPRFTGPTVATTQSRPSGRLQNFGGFTDGDRAACLADHFGAREIHLLGWDFENPSPKDAPADVKRRKLDWAYIVLGNLGRPEMEL
ncbi:MAG TPA: 6-hydroxymethylpterin diphosphokinase MptE-like protein [Thermoplasmata archaeon]|jgi:uncharacterized Rossmann fold enzyme